MSGREQSLSLAIAVSSGAGTGTLTNSWDIIHTLRICPPDEAATYTVGIKDGDGLYVFAPYEWTGTLPIADISLGIAKTIEITSATVDGSYIAKLDFH